MRAAKFAVHIVMIMLPPLPILTSINASRVERRMTALPGKPCCFRAPDGRFRRIPEEAESAVSWMEESDASDC